MPELPEVETIVRGLDKRITGDTIESVWIGSRPQVLKSPAASIAAALEGRKVVRVHRAGKHIVVDLVARTPFSAQSRGSRVMSSGRSAGSKASAAVRGTTRADERVRATSSFGPATEAAGQWIIHLGMTGRTVVCEPSEEVAKHTHLIAKLASGRELRFIDPRMFGKLSVHASGFDPGGIEPLEVTEGQFIALFRGRKTPIKSALLNQKLLRGVGNIYADESLFRAGIRPRRRASSLTKDQLRRLYRAVQGLLAEAIALGGSSVSDYVDADGEEGFFQLQHRVYGRENEPCLICKSSVRRIVIVGRSSHYCPQCQK
jgi:formamidopyrimidine-DNA glycosylase